MEALKNSRKLFANYDIESNLKSEGYYIIVGVDECGNGAGSGPVVAAACYIPDYVVPKLLYKVKDSKKLTEKRRESLYSVIRANCCVGVGVVNSATIDDVNILNATKMAMEEALTHFKNIDYVLIDGEMVLLNFPLPQQQIIQGDLKVLSIAAASIIAKVTRDHIMLDLHNILPIYGWNKNKGYLTKEHIKAIKEYGLSEFHRFTFNKVGNNI